MRKHTLKITEFYCHGFSQNIRQINVILYYELIWRKKLRGSEFLAIFHTMRKREILSHQNIFCEINVTSFDEIKERVCRIVDIRNFHTEWRERVRFSKFGKTRISTSLLKSIFTLLFRQGKVWKLWNLILKINWQTLFHDSIFSHHRHYQVFGKVCVSKNNVCHYQHTYKSFILHSRHCTFT